MAIFEEDTLVDEKFDDITEQDGASPVEATETPNKPSIPDKYVGKSLEDIVTMHQEAEKLIGRQAQEVGEVRKLADELIKQQLVPKQQEPVQQENEYDFFEDPKKAVRQAVDSHPDVLAAKQATLEMKQMRSQEVLNKKHPDMADVVKDSEFIEWVKASPVRLNLYAQADAQYNIEAADELLSTFKQIRSVKSQQTRDDGQQVLKQNLKAVGVDTGNGNGGSSQKIYRRTDLIRLQMTDPKRYAALGDEILEAYSQGRVK
jgi:hypothetical protein